MKKNNLHIFAMLLAMTAGNTFAERCNFPQHFEVVAPAGAHIMALEVEGQSSLVAKLSSETSFDIYDKSDCSNSGWYNNVKVKVGVDEGHFAQITFLDRNNNTPRIFESEERDGFHLVKIESLTPYTYKLTYSAK